ncbi:MAG: hypothetical protein E4H14_11335 [Candidatus Thorarchaeota archaeon]|nr:MAG: hypothetical protein E4H14_11335 [Candidatus Thorarchaeota archaeon]
MDLFHLRIDQIQLSQIYISSTKLADVMNAFDSGKESELEPIPIKELDGNLVSTDGHTRLLAWYLHGYKEVECVWEDEEMDWDAYRICVQWCKEEGIETIADLKGRILDPNEYQVLWLDRCRVMQDELQPSRNK